MGEYFESFFLTSSVLYHYPDVSALLIEMEGAQTPAGSPPALRKAKRLEWKSTASIHKQMKKDYGQTSIFNECISSLNDSKVSESLLLNVFFYGEHEYYAKMGDLFN
ncbi:hypothetical protein SD78_4030 [Bacillus badius]|nr:hypothetical protein SD78_4030 [Bacillus badius]